MCFHPGERIAGSIVKDVIHSQIQPASVDLRVGELFTFESPGLLGVEGRELPSVRRLEASGGLWHLAPGAYKVRFADVVEIPLDMVGFCFPRSSLFRMGATLYCGVWDPGYVGRGEALLLVFNPHGIRLEVGARVGQLVVARLCEGTSRGYSGAYKGENLDGRV